MMSGATGAALAFLKAFVPGRAPTARVEAEPLAMPEPPTEVPLPQQAGGARVSPDVLEPLRLRPEVEQVLLDIGMPPDDSPVYEGKRRPADKPEEAARKFVIWARAIGAVGSYPPGVICALYGECAAADHRVPVSDNRFLFALKHTPGIRRDLADADRRRRRWTIEPAEIVKPQPPPTPAKAIAKPPLNKPRLFHRYVPDQEPLLPALIQAKAREARRLGRARKQRGSRSHRAA
jgi:hypothetical protein